MSVVILMVTSKTYCNITIGQYGVDRKMLKQLLEGFMHISSLDHVPHLSAANTKMESREMTVGILVLFRGLLNCEKLTLWNMSPL